MRSMNARNVDALKQAGATHNRDKLSPYMADSTKFLRIQVTADETWAHNFDPTTKLQSKQWKNMPPHWRRSNSTRLLLLSVHPHFGAQWDSSDDWLLRPRKDCHGCLQHWVNRETECSHQGKTPSKVGVKVCCYITTTRAAPAMG